MVPDPSPFDRRDSLGRDNLADDARPLRAEDGASVVVLRAATILTMDRARPRAEAVAFDVDSGRIVAVGTLDACQAAFPAAQVRDLGHTVLMPGLIQAHDHPLPAALLCQLPAYWIAPFTGYPTFAHVEALFRQLQRDLPTGQPVMFNGLDRLLLQCPMPNRESLDGFFPDRPAVVFDITGHAVYFNTLATGLFGWKNGVPPPDLPDARWGRDGNGQSDGTGIETAAFGMALMAFGRGRVAGGRRTWARRGCHRRRPPSRAPGRGTSTRSPPSGPRARTAACALASTMTATSPRPSPGSTSRTP